MKPVRSVQRMNLQEVDALKVVFKKIDAKGDGFIDRDELLHAFTKVGYDGLEVTRYGTHEVDEMIWEVDEDLDQKVSWDEFYSCYRRSWNDRAGTEPHRLFDIIEFMLHDKDGNGLVDRDECLELMHRRQARDKTTLSKITERMIREERESDRQGVSLNDFLQLLRETLPPLKQAQLDLIKSTRTPRGGPKKGGPTIRATATIAASGFAVRHTASDYAPHPSSSLSSQSSPGAMPSPRPTHIGLAHTHLTPAGRTTRTSVTPGGASPCPGQGCSTSGPKARLDVGQPRADGDGTVSRTSRAILAAKPGNSAKGSATSRTATTTGPTTHIQRETDTEKPVQSARGIRGHP
eukprot:TRINITY_DN13585_c0_g1::TRINITY_DN13585_c0_g1_i1::g.22220::m.22220 TRINITY_DN13585_c0_g1::TRINITY_DN13585_c0_g1_i1::g.22220  ORF type:complete len:349 (-),score=8.29,sp/Q9LE22/CML27_ARATH/33.64/3e-07,EF-hand_7/PF13499.1/1.7e-11,EF-hand_7/PF13499.1/0.0015,EF-hand_7/PF13499.1/6.2e+03,EF-hand_1/PF00036.27/5e-06,EF-hand_1/PF00036.27/0.025,EF-hand_1/PF00036.27/0.002,EF-hand_1/PF00036.27/1.7e+03,EF-hand_1/PF00036.27/2.4e+02,EF-hand_8/PF13833.1/0.32,EF-hand_8/PF13833.1/1.3e-11,EF-hand_8/PF13833.1/2.8,EF